MGSMRAQDWPTLLLLCVIGHAALEPPTAAACGTPPVPRTLLEPWPETMPADGTLLLRFGYPGLATAADVRVTDADGARVPGAVLDYAPSDPLGLFAVWRPDAMLEEGASYTVQFDDWLGGGSSPVVQLVAEAPRGTTEPPFAMELLRWSGVEVVFEGERVCCEVSRDEGCYDECLPCPPEACFIDAVDTTVEVRLRFGHTGTGLDFGEWPEAADQFGFRVRTVDEDGEATTEWSPGLPPRAVVSADEGYCYAVEARHYASGERRIVLNGCGPGEEVFFLPDAEAVAERQARTTLQACLSPPPGYELDWCHALSDAASSGESFRAAMRECPALLEAGAADDDGRGAGAAGGASSASADPADAGDGGGCRVGAAGTPTAGLSWAFGWALAGLLLCLRRRAWLLAGLLALWAGCAGDDAGTQEESPGGAMAADDSACADCTPMPNPGGDTSDPGGGSISPGGDTSDPGGSDPSPGGDTSDPGGGSGWATDEPVDAAASDADGGV